MVQMLRCVVMVGLLATVGLEARADLLEFGDFQEWSDAVGGDFTTIDFTGFPDATFITDQYEDLGVLFLDGDDNVFCCDDITYPNDGSGLDGNSAIELEFTQPMSWIAADFPGGLAFELYFEGELIAESTFFAGGGVGFFAGIISDQPFDRATLFDWIDGFVFLDDLHFGPPIPAPGALPLLGGAALLLGRLRRRRR